MTRYWLQLALTDGLGPILTVRLIAAAGGVEAACAADAGVLRSVDGIGGGRSRTILESLRRAAGEVDAELERCRAAEISIIGRDDAEYPVMLRSIPDPPGVLFVRGNLQARDLHALAIVGSRRCTLYGREQSQRFGALLAQAGFTVVSGGARGIDSAAHRGAMTIPDGRTIAVLGCGVDIAYPPENQPLFEQIAAGGGAVVSEFPTGTPPMKEHFPRRNRIISGMSRGVLVIEADVASGALITARQACDDHGRPVLALPGKVDSEMSAGPHALIRDGATLVRNLEDILDELGPPPHEATVPDKPAAAADSGLFPAAVAPKAAEPVAPAIPISDRQRAILDSMEGEQTSMDAIITRSGLPAEVVMQELTMMSLRGMIRRVEGQTYVRREAQR